MSKARMHGAIEGEPSFIAVFIHVYFDAFLGFDRSSLMSDCQITDENGLPNGRNTKTFNSKYP